MELEDKDLKSPAWANSAFFVLERDFEEDSTTKDRNDGTEGNYFTTNRHNYWVNQRVRKEGKDIFAFLLLNGFGGGDLVTKHVGTKLIASIFDSNELKVILNTLKDENNSHLTDIDSKVADLIKSCFVKVDNECYEALQMLQIQKEEVILDSSLFLKSGCSAILALVLQNRLYMANCGNSVGVFGKIIGDGLMVFQVSETHEEKAVADPNVAGATPHFIAELCKSPYRCFGDYGRKTEMLENRQEYGASSEPFVIDGKIELNQTTRFLLLIPPTTFKVLDSLYPEQREQPSLQTNTPVSVLSKMIVDALEDSSKSPRKSIQEVLKELSNKFRSQFSNDFGGQLHPELCLAYIDLSNDYVVDALNERNSNAYLNQPKVQQALEPSISMNRALRSSSVNSYVDWSEFYTHELRDTVLAKIESIKQLYRERNTLTSIAEN